MQVTEEPVVVEPEPEKPKDKSKPVSSTPVPASPWCVVWTGDDKQFFYNPSKRISVWEIPEDLVVSNALPSIFYLSQKCCLVNVLTRIK